MKINPANIKKYFKTPATKPLPVYPVMQVSEIKVASVLLFYGGNKLTELVGNRRYGHPYKPPAFHAALYLDHGLYLNVGKFRTIEEVSKTFRATRRVDVIVYPRLTDPQRLMIYRAAILDTSRPKFGFDVPDYGFTDYLRFGFKWWKPANAQFCSENCVLLFQKGGLTISDQEPFNSAPWDILEHAEKYPEQARVYTIHQGLEFH